MSAFNTAALLNAWEEASSGPPVHRAIALLAAAWPETSASEWARLRIGARDGALLDLQEGMFGAGIEATARCPACGEQVELAFTTEQVRTPVSPAERVTVHREAYTVECRLPNSEDLLCLPRHSVEEARSALLTRCVERVVHEEQAVTGDAMPPQVVQAVIDAMAEADPQAEVRIAMECPECLHGWSMDFDITSYLWTEVQDWAHRVLRDVHALAGAYGWSEREVLGLSSQRRRLYLDMVEG